MKRDPEYQFSLLKEMEAHDEWHYTVGGPVMNWDKEDEKKWYHLQLLMDEGLVTYDPDCDYRLTSKGHDLLDLHRNENAEDRNDAE